MPGMTEPSTCPQMPGTSLSPMTSCGATMMSQVEVPMIFNSVALRMPAPTAPMCASNAPTATAAPAFRPSRAAHSSVSVPAAASDVQVSLNSRSFSPLRSGSSLTKNASSGRPPHASCHIALCPAAHRLRFIVSGSVLPVSSAGIQSQCSTHENAASRMLASSRSTCRIFAQNHSDE